EPLERLRSGGFRRRTTRQDENYHHHNSDQQDFLHCASPFFWGFVFYISKDPDHLAGSFYF
ncbi:MAG TPA: hypothetical protein PK619_03875, partial [bacterium]|nr:hypothetical protein [bacterium]